MRSPVPHSKQQIASERLGGATVRQGRKAATKLLERMQEQVPVEEAGMKPSEIESVGRIERKQERSRNPSNK